MMKEHNSLGLNGALIHLSNHSLRVPATTIMSVCQQAALAGIAIAQASIIRATLAKVTTAAR